MNWRIETEIDYFIVIKPSQAIETSQIFREKKAQTRYAAHTHWLHINDKIFIINIALHGYYILPDTVSGPGVGGGAHLIHMVQPKTGFDKWFPFYCIHTILVCNEVTSKLWYPPPANVASIEKSGCRWQFKFLGIFSYITSQYISMVTQTLGVIYSSQNGKKIDRYNFR